MKIFPVNKGFKYNAILNGQDRSFEVLEYDGQMYCIRWDNGDEEWAYPADMECWTDEWKIEHVFRKVKGA